jgi:hypothetical protein
VEFATKQIIAPALNTLVGDPKKVFEASYAQIHEEWISLSSVRNRSNNPECGPVIEVQAIVLSVEVLL